MEYLNKLTRGVYTVKDAVSSVLPGNPVNREYTAREHVASAGPGLCWKIYSGCKASSRKEVSIWVLLKKDVECWPARERAIILELVKRGVSQLTRLRHPRLLVVEHPLEESRDCLAFCTEPVFASLANALGRVDNMPSILPSALTDYQLLDIEIKHGLFQLNEALSFLHCDARILHRNICPESVIINAKGSWKLAGFDFCAASTSPTHEPPSYPLLEWDGDLMPCVQPLLDYMAPEYVLAGRCDAFADMFSMGVLSYAVFNKGKTPLNNGNSMNTFKKNAKELKALPASLVRSLPEDFRDDVKMCLNYTPDLRPDATQLSKVSYFEDVLVKTLNYLESLCQMDNSQKCQFFKGLANVLGRFPKRVLIQKVLPLMTAEFGTPELIPFILPNIFAISEQATEGEFRKTILPPLLPVFEMQNPPQIPLLLLQKMDLLLSKTPQNEIQKHLLPLFYSSLDSNAAQIQELCLNIIPRIAGMVDQNSMKTQLLPKLLKLTVDAPVLSVKVNSLVCLGKLLENLERWMVSDQILPSLPKINSKEPGVLMAILGIYKLAFHSKKHGISKEACAKSAMPFLIASSVETNLNVGQFENFMVLIKQMLEKVENEQINRLRQLSSLQEEQRAGVQDFSTVLNAAASPKLASDLKGIALDGVAALPAPGQSVTSPAKNKGPLTLEDKKRLAAEQENSIRYHKQKPLDLKSNVNGKRMVASSAAKPMANSMFADKVASNPLDLTASLGPSLAMSSAGVAPMKPMTSNPMMTSPTPMGMMSSPTPMGMMSSPTPTPISMTSPPTSSQNWMGNPSLQSMQKPMGGWATPSAIRPPPMPSNSLYNSAPNSNYNALKPMGGSNQAKMDMSSFDSLLTFGNSTPAAQQQQKQPKPAAQPLNSNSTMDDLLG